jgi:GMP synthase-like glutamine amidotransferase
MRIHSILHVEFEGLGDILDWAEEQNLKITYTRQYLDEPLPDLDAFDALIVMGGPMNIYEDDKFKWLEREKEFIASAIKNNKKIFGICLGAQLIAHCLGSKIYKNNWKEIGWFKINKKFTIHPFCPELNSIDEFTVFHWHGETFDLPQGTVRLFESPGCKNQGFELGNRIIGLQFHLEMNEQSLKNIIENCRNEIKEGNYIQSEEEILKDFDSYHLKNKKILYDLLNIFLLQKFTK